MYLAVTNVQPAANYQLIHTFANGERPLVDMNPYLETGIFKELQNVTLFSTVSIRFYTIEWDNEADMDPEILYADSTAFESQLASEPAAEYKTK